MKGLNEAGVSDIVAGIVGYMSSDQPKVTKSVIAQLGMVSVSLHSQIRETEWVAKNADLQEQ